VEARKEEAIAAAESSHPRLDESAKSHETTLSHVSRSQGDRSGNKCDWGFLNLLELGSRILVIPLLGNLLSDRSLGKLGYASLWVFGTGVFCLPLLPEIEPLDMESRLEENLEKVIV